MENIRYTLTLVGTYYTLEQLAQIESLPGQDGGGGETAGNGAPLAQIAFAGRSNVGKSSLINALAGRKQLAKVSATPGKTASVNFYQVSSNRPGFTNYYLVDLPGYGYAQRSKSEREKWAMLIDTYLRNTSELRAVAVLLDCRLEPQNSDLELIDFARSIGLKLLPILTKADKCKQNERAKRQAQWRKLLHGQTPVLTASTPGASGRMGIDELWKVMSELVNGTE